MHLRTSSTISITSCSCIINPLCRARAKISFHSAFSGIILWCKRTAYGRTQQHPGTWTHDRVSYIPLGRKDVMLVCARQSCACGTYLWNRLLPGRCLCPLPGAVAGKLPRSRSKAWGWTDSALAGMADWLRSLAARSDTPLSPLWSMKKTVRQCHTSRKCKITRYGLPSAVKMSFCLLWPSESNKNENWLFRLALVLACSELLCELHATTKNTRTWWCYANLFPPKN